MPDRLRPLTAVAAVLLVLISAAWLYRTTLRRDVPPAIRTASVPLAVADGRLVVTLGIGEADLRFIVDTGAERSAIGDRPARAIAAPLLGRTRLLGPGGSRNVPVASLDALRIGDLTVRRLPALVVASTVLGGYDGILGLDVLRLLDLRIDVAAGTLSLLPPIATGDGVPLIEVRAGIVAVTVALDGTTATAILDTGLPRTLLNTAAARAANLEHRPGAARRGLDGVPFVTSSATARSIRVGGTELLAHATVDVADAPLFDAAGLADRPALLLGADAFAACAFRIAWSAGRLLLCDQD